MRRVILLAAVSVVLASTGLGQSPLKFRSTELLGLSSGEAGSAGQVQTVNGVSKGPWFAGLGAGVDYYRFRSVPLFLSITRDIKLGKKDWIFLYADGGTNLPWYKRPPGSMISPDGGVVSSTFYAGEYWSGGLGYLWKLGNRTSKAILFSAGYTVKKLTEDQLVTNGCPVGALCAPPSGLVPVVYEYVCRTYQFMVGFRF